MKIILHKEKAVQAIILNSSAHVCHIQYCIPTSASCILSPNYVTPLPPSRPIFPIFAQKKAPTPRSMAQNQCPACAIRGSNPGHPD